LSIFERFRLINPHFMKISELLNEQNVIADLDVVNKESAIKQLVLTIEPLVGSELAKKSLDAVLERESVMSTGVGKGLAIPHGRVKGIEENFVAFARLKEPIAYGSIDQKPVNMIFLLIGPESQSSLHIKLLSRISKLMNNDDFRSRIEQCPSSIEIVNLFREEESTH
jgi:fructose-specific phosphotransferase system IIA component